MEERRTHSVAAEMLESKEGKRRRQRIRWEIRTSLKKDKGRSKEIRKRKQRR